MKAILSIAVLRKSLKILYRYLYRQFKLNNFFSVADSLWCLEFLESFHHLFSCSAKAIDSLQITPPAS